MMPALLAAALLASQTALAGGLSVVKGPRQEVTAHCLSATRSLDVLLPRLADAALAQALETRAKSGILVRLLLDPGYKSNRRAAAAFRKAGFKLRWLRQGGPGGMNARLIIADSARLLTGSFEGTASSLDERLESLVESGDAVQALVAQQRFDQLWRQGSVKMEEGVVLDDALEKMGDPRTDEERTPRIKKRSDSAP